VCKIECEACESQGVILKLGGVQVSEMMKFKMSVWYRAKIFV